MLNNEHRQLIRVLPGADSIPHHLVTASRLAAPAVHVTQQRHSGLLPQPTTPSASMRRGRPSGSEASMVYSAAAWPDASERANGVKAIRRLRTIQERLHSTTSAVNQRRGEVVCDPTTFGFNRLVGRRRCLGLFENRNGGLGMDSVSRSSRSVRNPDLSLHLRAVFRYISRWRRCPWPRVRCSSCQICRLASDAYGAALGGGC